MKTNRLIDFENVVFNAEDFKTAEIGTNDKRILVDDTKKNNNETSKEETNNDKQE